MWCSIQELTLKTKRRMNSEKIKEEISRERV